MANIIEKLRVLVALLKSTGRLPDTWQKIQPCDVILQAGDGTLNYTYQGKAYRALWDSIGDLFTDRGLVVRTVSDCPGTRLAGTCTHNESFSCNRALVFGTLNEVLHRKAGQLIAPKAVAAEWASRKGKVRLWQRIFEKVRPRCVIGNMPDPALCWAGKIAGVPIYDLQHGIISDQHAHYGIRYPLFPASDLPNGYLCWDEVSAATLKKWAPQKGIDVRVIGNPWALRFLFPAPSDQLVQDALNKGRIFNNSKPSILVTLQWGFKESYPDEVPNGVMLDALEKTILQTANKYNWHLRLHPIQVTGREKPMVYEYLERTFGQISTVEWQLSSATPLPLILSHSALHITFNSTVVIESGWMGLRSALLDQDICPGGRYDQYYAHERNLGLATVLPQDVTVIKRWIEENIGKERMPSTLIDYRKNLEEFIDEVMSK